METFGLFHHTKFGKLPLYYAWKDIPDNYVTEMALKERGMRLFPGQKPVAVVHTQSHRRHRYDLLYSLEDAIENRPLTKRQKTALQRVKARNKCQQCGVAFVELSKEGYCINCQGEFAKRQDARNLAIQWANVLLQQPFVLLDTETTGLGTWDRIVEIAVLDEAGRIVFNTLLNPGIGIPAGVITIHGITDDMVWDKPTFQEILPELEQVLTGKPVVIYNVAFDKRFLARSGLRVQNYNFQCAMLMYAKFFGAWSDSRNSWKWQSLEKACLSCGISRYRMHRAVADCQATLDIIHYMARANGEPQEDKMFFDLEDDGTFLSERNLY
jgi:DNA polymerase-3 subunit epsilon